MPSEYSPCEQPTVQCAIHGIGPGLIAIAPGEFLRNDGNHSIPATVDPIQVALSSVASTPEQSRREHESNTQIVRRGNDEVEMITVRCCFDCSFHCPPPTALAPTRQQNNDVGRSLYARAISGRGPHDGRLPGR